MQVGILVFKDVEELDFVGPLEVFGIASRLVESMTVLTVSKEGQPLKARYGLQVQPDYSFANCPSLDLLIVPGGKGAREYARYDKEILNFVATHASNHAIASVCTGAIVLAEAGILSGKRATTHHSSIDALRQYANVHVVENARFVFEGDIATSAGISAGIDLALELVRRHLGDKIADQVEEIMEYDYPIPKNRG
jgi:transcriptional regulator GlxA family with amidase domain